MTDCSIQGHLVQAQLHVVAFHPIAVAERLSVACCRARFAQVRVALARCEHAKDSRRQWRGSQTGARVA